MNKMKTFRTLASLAIFCVVISCKKDNGSAGETPLQTLIKTSALVDATIIHVANNESYEFGNKFYASRNGTITHLGCYLPYKGNIRVSLWDFATKNIIAATTVVSDSTDFVYVDIPDVAIVANQRYVISVNNNSGGVGRNYYFRNKKGSSAAIYPCTSGSITLEGLYYINSDVSAFPTTSYPSSFGGFFDFKFK